MSGGGQRSPPRGGVDPDAPNQQLLVDDDEEDNLPASAAAGLTCHCVSSTVATECLQSGYTSRELGSSELHGYLFMDER